MTNEEKLKDALELLLRNLPPIGELTGSLHLAVLHAQGVLKSLE